MRPTPKFPYLEHDGILAFAHRGGNLQAPKTRWQRFPMLLDRDIGF